MRILLFSDLHGHNFRPYSDLLPGGRNSRLQDTLNILAEIEEVCRNQAVEGVLFGGDTFHARGTINVRAFNEVCQAMARINIHVSFFGVLVGNHDQSDRTGIIYSTETFKSFLTVMDEPRWYSFGDALDVMAVPYHPDKATLLAHLQGIAHAELKAPVSCLLGHFGISGGKVGSNFVLVSDFETSLSELPYEDFDQVFLGHYHLPQTLLPNVRFIGATHQHNWGDAEQERGCWLWDTEPDQEFSTPTFTPLTSAPRFVSLPYDNVINPKVDISVTNDFVRIVCPATLTADDWAEIASHVLSKGARRVEPWVEATQHAGKSNPNHAKFNPGVDFEDMIERYVEVTEHELSSARLVEIGQSILKEVSK